MGEPSARLSQWEGRARGVCVGGWGEGGAAGAAGGRGPGGGGQSPRGARRVNPSAAGRVSRAARAAGAGAAVGSEGGSREPRARASGAQRGDTAERGPRLGGGRRTGVRAAQAQAAPGRARVRSRERSQGLHARSPVRPRPCSAWPRGAGTTARQGYPKPSVGPGWAGVGGGPPGPPMGSGCRCGGATSRRRTPSWTPSSASLRARVSGGGADGAGARGGGRVLPSVNGGGGACPGRVHMPRASQRG